MPKLKNWPRLEAACKAIALSIHSLHLPIFIGMLIFGISMGFFTGFSSSPMLSTVVPLFFGFVASGGLLLSFFRNGDASPDASERRKRATFVAMQAAGFSIGLLAGFWGGVHLRYNPDDGWTVTRTEPAYAHFNVTSPVQLQSLRRIDQDLATDGVPLDRRIVILGSMLVATTPSADGKPLANQPEVKPASTEASPNPFKSEGIKASSMYIPLNR